MPRFNQLPSNNGSSQQSILPIKIEPRCKACTSKYRAVIDQMLVSGSSYTDIERALVDTDDPVPRRSISNHVAHLNYEDAAVRRSIEKYAKESAINVETATQRLITRELYLRTVIEKGFDELISGKTELTLKDVTKAIELLSNYEKDASYVALDHLKLQYNALVAAVKDIIPNHLWSQIVTRAEEIYENKDASEPVAQLQLPDANVVEDARSDGSEGDNQESSEVSGTGDDPGLSSSLDSPESS